MTSGKAKIIKRLQLSFCVVSLLLLSLYFYVGSSLLAFHFYGPWAGLGVHQSPPKEALFFVVCILTFLYMCFATVQNSLNPKFKNPFLSKLSSHTALILAAYILCFSLLFSTMFSTGAHQMIVDTKDPSGASMGESYVQLNYLSQFLCFLIIPAIFNSIFGLLRFLMAKKPSLKPIYLFNLVLGILWVIHFLNVAAGPAPYFY